MIPVGGKDLRNRSILVRDDRWPHGKSAEVNQVRRAGRLFLQASQSFDHFGTAMPHFAAMNPSQIGENRTTESG